MSNVMFSLSKMADGIYHLEFSNKYDLGMTFLRYQEYYESPRFRHRIFTIAEYMDWYVKNGKKKSFTYPADWSGYNIPVEEIEECMAALLSGVVSKDWNHRDSLMQGVITTIRAECTGVAYLIGTSKESDIEVLEHEFAHALFTTDRKYAEEVGTAWMRVNATQVWCDVVNILKDQGYSNDVMLDEAQAYCIGGKDILSHLEENHYWREFADSVRSEFQKRYEKATGNEYGVAV